MFQEDYEKELDLSRSAHKRELARSKDDMLSQLAAAEASSLQIDEDTIRKRYEKEIDRIKVWQSVEAKVFIMVW